MITILLEQPVPILIVGLLFAAAMGLAFVSTGKLPFGIVAMVAVVVTCALLGLEWAVETDRERVESALYSTAAAVETNDVQAIVEHVSKQSPSVRADVDRIMSRVTVASFSIKSNLDIMVNSEHRPALATAAFNCVATGRYKGESMGNQTYPVYMKINFRREEDGVWRVTSYEMYDFAEGMRSEAKRKSGGSTIPLP